MNVAAALGLAREARDVAHKLRSERVPGSTGRIAVSGVLAEQLARELGAGARPGAVEVGGDTPTPSAEILVRVVAGAPTDTDLAFVRTADRRGAPVVLVQLWPQADWTLPFVLSPFVVECRAGEGFPVGAIADRIVDASGQSSLLAAAVPTLRRSLERKIVLRSVVRAAAMGAFRGRMRTRPLIMGEQVRMISRLVATGERGGISADPKELGAVTGAVLASGFAFRGVARTARFVLPASVANAVVAAAGTWALAGAAKAFGARRAS